MSARAVNLNELLEKTSHWDKDERYMATSDICNELQRDVKVDASMERRICIAILKQLDDPINDVQSIAVKCLSILVKKVAEPQICDICDKLCSLILDPEKKDLRDIYSIGLKTLIKDVPAEMGSSVAMRLSTRLLSGVDQSQDDNMKEVCLDILTDILGRFGAEVMRSLGGEMEDERRIERCMGIILNQLSNRRRVVRKRATACTGAFAVMLPDKLLTRLTEILLQMISADGGGSGGNVPTLIQTIGTISRTVGFRLGRLLGRIVPLFLSHLGAPEDEGMQSKAHDELRENILHAFASFVERCVEIDDHLESVLAVVLQFVQYDPNYLDDSSDEEESEEESEEEFSDDDDDDDDSWKVRRASVKVLSGVITARPKLLKKMYQDVSSTLISRFREREENVKLDILACFTSLLRATLVPEMGMATQQLTQGFGLTDGAGMESKAAAAASSAGDGDGDDEAMPSRPTLTRQRSAVELLKTRVQNVVAESCKLLSSKSVKTRVAVFKLLRQLCIVLMGNLDAYLPKLVPLSARALQDRNSTLKLEALSFLRLLLESHSASALQPFVPDICPALVAAVAEDWYKIIAEALAAIGSLVAVMRPTDASGAFTGEFQFADDVPLLFDAVVPRLAARDIDQEIKERAIACTATLLAALGDQMAAQQRLPELLQLLLERLQNDITRLSVLKAMAVIARSPLQVPLSLILDDSVPLMAAFLRQSSRVLQQTTLSTLTAILASPSGAEIELELLSGVLHEASALVSEDDLYLTHLALTLASAMLQANDAASSLLLPKLLPRAISLASSAVLQGRALSSLLSLFTALVGLQADGCTFPQLLDGMVQPVVKGGQLPRASVRTLSRCVSALIVAAGDTARGAAIDRFVQDASAAGSAAAGGDGGEVSAQLSLLTLGEVGRCLDLAAAGHSSLPQDVLLPVLSSGAPEDVKAAAAFAAGSLAVGNPEVFLPLLLSALEDTTTASAADSAREYLLLSAVKEVIAGGGSQGSGNGGGLVAQVLPLLLHHCESKEEGVRNMVAECLGLLVLLAPAKLVPQLSERVSEEGVSALARWTLVTSLKYCITHPAAQQQLRGQLTPFLALLEDSDLSVRRAALLMLNSVAHHNPAIIRPQLNDVVFPVVFAEMTVKPELKRVVDLGPFKHKVDDGLPLRKASFSFVSTLLDTLPQALDVPTFLPLLKRGLADHEDIQMLCHQIVVKLCRWSSSLLLGALDSLIDPLEATVNRKMTGPAPERSQDVTRSALRAVDAISRLPTAASNRKFCDFCDRLARKDQLHAMLLAIREERSSAGAADAFPTAAAAAGAGSLRSSRVQRK